MNTEMSSKPTLIVIVGPTAVGKSSLALHLASCFSGEVVNSDSRQVYRGMEIGTAAPSRENYAYVPHHLYGIVDPDDGFNIAQFIPLASQAIQGVHERGNLPILVGGTGQYINGLVQGWTTPRVPPNPVLREQLVAKLAEDGIAALMRRLEELDPLAAARVDTRNPRRIIRAIEVREVAGSTPGAVQNQTPPYNSFLIGLTTSSRAELHQRIDERVDQMIDDGWIPEVRALIKKGYSQDLPALSSMGYRELIQFLAGEMSLEETVRLIKVSHHRLARNQYTWFKPTDSRINWFVTGEGYKLQVEVALREWLNNG